MANLNRRDARPSFTLSVDLTPAELALLEFTNGSATSQQGQRILLTSKESYLWASFIAKCVEMQPNLSSTTFAIVTQSVIAEFPTPDPTGAHGFEASASASEATYLRVFFSFAQQLGIAVEPSDIQKSAQDAYASLVTRGLIEDPFFLPLVSAVSNIPHLQAIGVAVLGLVPIEFGRVTEQGKQTSLKIKSLYMDYERTVQGAHVSTHINFRLLQFVKMFLDLTRNGLDGLDGSSPTSSNPKPAGRRTTSHVTKKPKA